ncbi:phosphatidate cytidylyltransferase [Roseiterribacter gracilis]|uniref:Phosphatidate cytidylyltransferase n=1 Tax=Roseiterribacter gracilis TaxID=2812848 RepID=A0A8S8XBF3_9PROT|nr:phosphatidate cytidylyltransferase [Rhodospirillales bacterium TMPK1]
MSGEGHNRNLLQRIVSALVLAPPVIAAAIWGGTLFDLLVFAFTAAALREWLRMTWPDPELHYAIIAYVGLFFLLVATWSGGLWPALATFVITGAGLYVLARVGGAQNPRLSTFGLAYVGASLVSLAWLRGHDPHGWQDLLFVLPVVWAADIGGYAVGRSLGGPKLWPRISPKKTWAGVVGGFALALLVAFLWAEAFAAPVVATLAVAAFVAALALAGDLFESAIKRRQGVKDSGGLIPGHGGVLDRIDAALLAVPGFALLVALAGRLTAWH